MENREKLKEAAIKLVVSKGFQATSTASVSKKAKLATGTLFNYFKSKDEMLASIYIDCLSDRAQFVLDKLEAANTADNEENMQLIWDGLAKWGLGNKNPAKYIKFYGASPFAAGLAKELADTPSAKLREKVMSAIAAESGLGLSNDLLYESFMGQLDALVGYVIKEKISKSEIDDISFEAFQVYWDAIR